MAEIQSQVEDFVANLMAETGWTVEVAMEFISRAVRGASAGSGGGMHTPIMASGVPSLTAGGSVGMGMSGGMDGSLMSPMETGPFNFPGPAPGAPVRSKDVTLSKLQHVIVDRHDVDEEVETFSTRGYDDSDDSDGSGEDDEAWLVSHGAPRHSSYSRDGEHDDVSMATPIVGLLSKTSALPSPSSASKRRTPKSSLSKSKSPGLGVHTSPSVATTSAPASSASALLGSPASAQSPIKRSSATSAAPSAPSASKPPSRSGLHGNSAPTPVKGVSATGKLVKSKSQKVKKIANMYEAMGGRQPPLNESRTSKSPVAPGGSRPSGVRMPKLVLPVSRGSDSESCPSPNPSLSVDFNVTPRSCRSAFSSTSQNASAR